MKVRHALVAIGAWGVLGVAHAEPPAKKNAPAVVKAGAAPVRVAPNDKARVHLLARGDNAFVGRLEMAPGASVPEHCDPTEEYIYVLEGEGVITIDGQKHPVAPGTMIYMPAGALVTFQNGDQPFVALQVFAGPTPADKYDRWKPRPAARK